MPYSNLQQAVLENELCASCGACYTVCPEDVIEMGPLVPRLADWSDGAICGACNDCVEACPGLDPGTRESEQQLFGRVRHPDERWLGIFQSCYAGRATEAKLFESSASGGSATALLQSAAESLELDCVIVAGRDLSQPWLAKSAVCFDSSQLVNHTQSTYQLFPHLASLKQVLLDGSIRRVGVSGLPCHIQAIRKIQRLDSFWGQRFREALVFCLEIACSSNTKPVGTETLITELMGIRLENVKGISFRDGDYPGQITVGLKQGGIKTVPFWQAVRHFKNHKTHRCLSCGDWLSGLADISVCDGDPNVFLSSQVGAAHSKHGMLLVRTTTGKNVLDWALQRNTISAHPAALTGLNLGLDRKRNRRANYEQCCKPIPLGPIPDYCESIEPVDDDTFIPAIEEPVRSNL